MDYLVLDIQCFRDNANNYVVKELACFRLFDYRETHLMFLPPFPFDLLYDKVKRNNLWIGKNLLHLSWDSGHEPYCYLDDVLEYVTKNVQCIYVKGSEKAYFVRTRLDYIGKTYIGVYNMDHIKWCPQLSTLRRRYQCGSSCIFNHGLHNCAQINAHCLYKWLKSKFY